MRPPRLKASKKRLGFADRLTADGLDKVIANDDPTGQIACPFLQCGCIEKKTMTRRTRRTVGSTGTVGMII